MKFNFMKLLGKSGNEAEVDSQGRVAIQDINVNLSKDEYYPNGNLLFHSNFDRGFDGWVPNFAGSINGGMWGTISLTTGMHGNRSLMLGTGQVGSTEPYGNVAAIKRNTTIKESGLFSFDGWIDMSSLDRNQSPSFILLGVDYQRINVEEQLRRFLQVRFMNSQEGTLKRVWQVFTDGKVWVDIPGSEMEMPWNENKVTFVYFRLTVDLGTLRFVELQVYNKVFDLSTYEPFKDVYHVAFDGGLNTMVQLVNTSNSTLASNIRLDSPRGYYHD